MANILAEHFKNYWARAHATAGTYIFIGARKIPAIAYTEIADETRDIGGSTGDVTHSVTIRFSDISSQKILDTEAQIGDDMFRITSYQKNEITGLVELSLQREGA